MASYPKPPQHFYTLDAFRGIAAMIVVTYHWQFFYYADYTYVPGGYDKTALPLYRYFSLFYNDAPVAVDLFFLLSGFIFFWLYADKVANHKLTFRKFMGYRLSRLYPIHFVTLILVAILQWLMLKTMGHYFIGQYNDAYHFVLNLLFLQSWGFEKGPSFNGPAWSASVEVFLYLVFFLVCYLRLQNKKVLLLLMLPIGAFLQYYFSLIGKGMYSFFLGALVYYWYIWLVKEHKANKTLPLLITITVSLWIMILAEYHLSFMQNLWLKYYPLVMPGKKPESALAAFGLLRNFFFRTAVAPCTVLTFALWETVKGTINSKWGIMGNCSYAMYLLHFPLMITFALGIDLFGINRMALHSPYTLLLFFLVLIPLSFVAYYYFELPAQEKIRATFFKKNKPNISITEVEIIT